MRKSKPLLVNISGMRHAGVTSACERIARCLTGMGFNTVVVKTATGRDCSEFSDDLVLGKYNDVDVVLFDKHFFTESAARRNLHNQLWSFADDLPDLSLLMSPAESINERHKVYLELPHAHYGTSNHHVISTKGRDGKLYAAGNMKALIIKELRHA